MRRPVFILFAVYAEFQYTFEVPVRLHTFAQFERLVHDENEYEQNCEE